MRAEVCHYHIPLTSPLILNVGGAVQRLNAREGLLVRCEWQGKKIITECAPLPGFSAETLAHCNALLADQGWLNQVFDYFQQGKALPEGMPVSLVYALEAAWFIGQQDLPPVPRYDALNICQLYTPEQPLSGHCIKVKVGRGDLKDDIALIQSLSRQLSAHQTLRLDANQSWSVQALESVLNHIDLNKIDYLEEPLALNAQHEYAKLIEKYPVNIALDEGLRQLSVKQCLAIPAHTWVLKPMLMGFNATCERIKVAKENAIDVVLSTSFESNISLEFYAQLAQLFELNAAQGLDTLSYLQTDLMHHSPLRAEKVKVSHAESWR